MGIWACGLVVVSVALLLFARWRRRRPRARIHHPIPTSAYREALLKGKGDVGKDKQ